MKTGRSLKWLLKSEEIKELGETAGKNNFVTTDLANSDAYGAKTDKASEVRCLEEYGRQRALTVSAVETRVSQDWGHRSADSTQTECSSYRESGDPQRWQLFRGLKKS